MVSNFCYQGGLNNENILRYEYWLRLHGKQILTLKPQATPASPFT